MEDSDGTTVCHCHDLIDRDRVETRGGQKLMRARRVAASSACVEEKRCPNDTATIRRSQRTVEAHFRWATLPRVAKRPARLCLVRSLREMARLEGVFGTLRELARLEGVFGSLRELARLGGLFGSLRELARIFGV